MLPRFNRVPREPWKDRLNNIRKALKDVKEGRKVSIETYEKRLSICGDCEFYHKYATTCNVCGCFMKIKAASPSMKCPIDKWSSTNSCVQRCNKDK